MFNSQIVKDRSGQRFKIQISKDKYAPLAVKPQPFHNSSQASQFINSLIVPTNFWKNLYKAESLIAKPVVSESLLRDEVARLFSMGKVKAYKIDMPSNADSLPEKRTVTDNNKHKHTFLLTSSLLVSQPREVKTFTNEKEAKAFLDTLNPSKEQLETLTTELKISVPIKGTAGSDVTKLICTALATGAVVIAIDRYTAPPKPADSTDAAVFISDKKAELAPETDNLKDISLQLNDEFDNKATAYLTLFDDLEYTIKTDLGEEHKGTIKNGLIEISQAKMNKGFELLIKDMPAFLDV